MTPLKGRMVKAGFLLVILASGILAMYSMWLVDQMHSRALNNSFMAQSSASLDFLDKPELDNQRDLFYLEPIIVEALLSTKAEIEPAEPYKLEETQVATETKEPEESVSIETPDTELAQEINPVAEYTYVGYLQKGNSLDAFLMLGESSLVVRSGDWLSPRLFIQSITDENVVINVKPSGKIYKLVINEENI